MVVSLYWPLSVLCVFVCLRVKKSTSKKLHYLADLSKLDALLRKTHPSGTEIPRLEMSRSILSLSKIAHQMWCDHQFSQRNKATERTGGAEETGKWESRLDKILKRG